MGPKPKKGSSHIGCFNRQNINSEVTFDEVFELGTDEGASRLGCNNRQCINSNLTFDEVLEL